MILKSWAYEREFDSAVLNREHVLNATSCTVKEVLNGKYELTLVGGQNTTPVENEEIIYAAVPDGTIQPFRVYNITADKVSGEYTASARHIFYDLLNNFLEDVRAVNAAPKDALAKMLNGMMFESRIPFTTTSEMGSTILKSAYWQYMNPVEALIGDTNNSFINRWGGELRRDCNRIEMYDRYMNFIHTHNVIFGKNLKECDLTQDISSVVTRIMPTGLKSDGQTVLKIPEGYIDSEHIDDYIDPKVRRIHYTDIRVGTDEFKTEEDAYEELRSRARGEFAKGVDLPTIEGDLNVFDLLNTREYRGFENIEKIEPFCNIRIIFKSGEVLETRMVGYEFDCLTKKYKNITHSNINRRDEGIFWEMKQYADSKEIEQIKADVEKLKGQ